MMQISFYGAANCVTGSNFLITTKTCKFLVDCGMFQGSKSLKENNYKNFPYDPAEIDFVLVTHAHIDHSGLIPKLVKHGFDGPIYSTAATLDLLKYLLPDSAYIQQFEVAQKNRRNKRKGLEPIEAIYDENDASKAISLFKTIERYEAFEPAKGCEIVFHNAGHVLGSSFIEINLIHDNQKKRIIFSGDLGQDDRPIVNDADQFDKTDYLVIESTYGNRNRSGNNRQHRLDSLKEVLEAGIKRGGKILIPAFALERTQELMHDILELKSHGHLSSLKVVVDSPLATNITKVFMKYPCSYDDEAAELKDKMGALFNHPDFRFTNSVEESIALNKQKGIAVLSASGMCDAGRIKHHLKHGLWNPQNTVIFVGYQAEGTLGRVLQQGAKKVRIHGEEISVGAAIEEISGYSGHADQNGLFSWLSSVESLSGKVFIVHGEPAATKELAKLMKEKRNFEAIIPELNDSYDLLSDKPLTEEKHQAHASEKDSYNLYAKLMLEISNFMRKEVPEEHKQSKLNQLIDKVKE